MKNLGSDRKKKANLIKSSDELNVQFSFVKKTIQEIVDDFVEKTNQSLMGMRQIDDEDQARKKNIEAVRKAIKKSANSLEDQVEELVKNWKKEVKKDIKDSNRYNS